MTVAQQKAFDTCWPRWGLEIETGLLSFDEIFGREAPTVLEIGFGMGQSLAEMATEHPDWNFIGVEVHRPGVGKLFHTLEEAGLDNVRVFNADALDVVNHCIPSASLDRVQIYFPDPWHKKRHHKRRLIQSEFVDALTQRLKSGGELHLATDWENYAEHMLDVLGDQPELSNKAEDDGFLPRPDSRPLTKFELRGQRLGHGVWDLVFIRR